MPKTCILKGKSVTKKSNATYSKRAHDIKKLINKRYNEYKKFRIMKRKRSLYNYMIKRKAKYKKRCFREIKVIE